MRRRLIVAFVLLASCIIAAYGIPRATMIIDQVHATESHRAGKMATFLSFVVAEREKTGPVTEEFLSQMLSDGERATYLPADRPPIEVGAAPGEGEISESADVAGGGSLTYARSAEAVSQRAAEAVRPVAVLGIVLLAASVIVAVLLSRRLSRPFVELADTARTIGRGGIAPRAKDLRIPEARAIDMALRESAQTLEKRIRREHEFAANASHQLRTPITALRLELEDLTLWPQTPPAVRDQLDHAIREIDRLTDAIAQLLELARSDSINTDASEPLAEMLRGAAARWTPQATALKRRIVIGDIDAALGSTPTAASQILDVLLHNALVHGRGTVTVTGLRRAGYNTVQVSDEGERPGGNVVFERRPDKRSATSGEGIGLALSAEIAESLGGHLLLEGDETTTFSLMLPAREPAEGDRALTSRPA